MGQIESQLQNALFNKESEKTFIDKLLAKDDGQRIKELISTKKLKREEMLELLYLLGGNESKLVNYGEWDRYIILKYFVWIRQFVKICENLYDYDDDIKKKDKHRKVQLSARSNKLLENIDRNLQHASKFNIDLYLNIMRTTLSLGGTGFIEMLKNKFEFSYPQGQNVYTPQENQKTGIFKRN